jgi:tetratricopeptide (TPR) repeat protein
LIATKKTETKIRVLVAMLLLLTCSTILSGCFKEWDLNEVKGWYDKQPETWDEFIAAANTDLQAGKTDKAAEKFQHALEMAEAQWGPSDLRVATSAKQYAMMLASRYKNAEAEPLFKRALEIQAKQMKPSDPDLLDTRKRLHDVLLLLFKPEEAKQALGNIKLDSTAGKGRRAHHGKR